MTSADTILAVKPSASRDAWLGKDKMDHLVVSAGITATQYYVLAGELDQEHRRSRALAAGTTLAIGIAKEVFDKVSGKGTASVKDIVADVLGIAVAVALAGR